jgi:putative SOS response-associated peptidase YedK
MRRSYRSVTVASTKATLGLQRQEDMACLTSSANKSLHASRSVRPIQNTKIIAQNSAQKKMKIFRRWKPSAWKRGDKRTRARTTFVGGLETGKHQPSFYPTKKRCTHSDDPTHTPSPSVSWLRWDKNPMWAVKSDINKGPGEARRRKVAGTDRFNQLALGSTALLPLQDHQEQGVVVLPSPRTFGTRLAGSGGSSSMNLSHIVNGSSDGLQKYKGEAFSELAITPVSFPESSIVLIVV